MEDKKFLTKEMLLGNINSAQEDINTINLLMNETFNKISAIVEERIHLKRKMGRKQRYINKLMRLIDERFPEQIDNK